MPRQPGATGPDTGLRLPQVVVYQIDNAGLLSGLRSSHREGNPKFPGKFVWIFVMVFGLVLGFFTYLFWWGVCLFVFLFGLSLVTFGFFHSFFFLFKEVWTIPFKFSIQMGLMLFLQLTAGFQAVHVSHNDNKSIDWAVAAWRRCLISKQHYLHTLFMGSSDSQIKTLLETGLKMHGTDLREFMELFYIKFACNCEPYLRSRKKKCSWK